MTREKIRKFVPKPLLKAFRRVRRKFKKLLTRYGRHWYDKHATTEPVDDKLVLFISFLGRGFSDNPRGIYECMIKDPRWQGYKFVWAIRKPRKKKIVIPDAEIVQYASIKYYKTLARAKFWIINNKMPGYVVKKPDQIYLQTWHGTPLKRLGHDIIVPEGTTFYKKGLTFEEMANTYDIDVAKYNYMISPNAFCTEVFPSAFGVPKEKLIETGYPRNDALINVTPEEVAEIKERYKIPEGKKVLLYAPTWRDNDIDDTGFHFELQADFHKWKEILGDEWVLLFKPHYLIYNKIEKDEDLKEFLYRIPASREISDLYKIADAMVTDYSSVFFDYANMNRPMYFYMYDLETYGSELRGFYLDINKDLPGKIYKSEEEMLTDIRNEDYDYDKLKKFNARFNNNEDGHASQRVVDILTKDQ